MKKVILMAFLAAGTAFTSCSKDDDGKDDGIKQDPLVGSWVQTDFTTTFEGKVKQETTKGCDGEDVTGEFRIDGTHEFGKFEGDTVGSCENSKGTWENLSDGNYRIEEGGDAYTLNIVFSGDTFTATSDTDGDGEFSTVEYTRVK